MYDQWFVPGSRRRKSEIKCNFVWVGSLQLRFRVEVFGIVWVVEQVPGFASQAAMALAGPLVASIAATLSAAHSWAELKDGIGAAKWLEDRIIK